MAQKFYPFYNVTQAVGKSCPNLPDDVMLVQFFIRELSKDPSVGTGAKPSSPITVDGLYTPALGEWILWIQKSLNAKSPGSTLADGRVDPARGMANDPKFLKSSISHTQYTIVTLNASYRYRQKSSHDALENDGRVPQLLRQKFASDDYVYADGDAKEKPGARRAASPQVRPDRDSSSGSVVTHQTIHGWRPDPQLMPAQAPATCGRCVIASSTAWSGYSKSSRRPWW
jgi:hypothetical protein